MRVNTEIRLRSRVTDAALQATVVGKILDPRDFDLLITGSTRVIKPDGRPLCVYLPGAMAEFAADPEVYAILASLNASGKPTQNRANASGTRYYKRPDLTRRYAMAVRSYILGAVDPIGPTKYCRLTAWTGKNLPEWQRLAPALEAVAGHLKEHVPDRYANQAAAAEASDQSWIVPGTPFSTVTVNNSYATGVHTDKGDLDAGFSTIFCLRRGNYTGGNLVFPAWRVAADLQDGDLILMDAHDWHGNVALTCEHGQLNGPCRKCGAERISVVSYFRTKVQHCGTPADEAARGVASRMRAGRA